MDRKQRKITPALEKEILAQAAEGNSARTIAAWLLAERGLKITHQAVGQLLRHTRQTRAEVAKVVVREQLAKTVLSDLERLDRSLKKVGRIELRTHSLALRYLERLANLEESEGKRADFDSKKAKEEARARTLAFEHAHFFVDAALKATDRVRALANTKLHFSGADEEDDGDLSRMKKTANDELLTRLDRLADRLAPGSGTPGSDPLA